MSLAKEAGHDFSNGAFRLFDKENNVLYYENSSGFHVTKRYDKRNNVIYRRKSTGYWEKYAYDKNNLLTYYENSNRR